MTYLLLLKGLLFSTELWVKDPSSTGDIHTTELCVWHTGYMSVIVGVWLYQSSPPTPHIYTTLHYTCGCYCVHVVMLDAATVQGHVFKGGV